MPTPLLVLLIVLAVAGGLYVGFTASQHRSVAASERPPKSLGTRAREAATRGALGLWRWNRDRKNKSRDDD